MATLMFRIRLAVSKLPLFVGLDVVNSNVVLKTGKVPFSVSSSP